MNAAGSLARLRSDLVDIVGPEHVLTDGDMVAGYVTDWTGAWRGETAAVVRPSTVEEIRRVLAICREAGIPIVPQGGNTGMVGGSVPRDGEVVVSLRRLRGLGPVDARTGQVTAGAGVTISDLRHHVTRAGFDYGVDLASRDSATVGGTIATNAGGIHVIAHGDTRRQVLGVEAVLADGSLVSRMGGIEKDSAGYDLTQLLVGSEGTLGVITAARLRLVRPMPGERHVVLVGVDRPSAGLEFRGPGVTALEFVTRRCVEMVAEHHRRSMPLEREHPYYVLAETSELPALAEHADAAVDERLWLFREAVTETLSSRGVPAKYDVGVPLDRLDEFVENMESIGGDVYVFGHLAEGNCHVNVLGRNDVENVTNEVLGRVVELGGTIASEHGVGTAKTEWLARTLGPGELEAMRRIKRALDPAEILNPGVIFPR